MSLDDVVSNKKKDIVTRGSSPGDGNPYTPERDSEEYWLEVWRQACVDDPEDVLDEDIAAMSSYAAVLPHFVIDKLIEYKIIDLEEDPEIGRYIKERFYVEDIHGEWQSDENDSTKKMS